MLDNFQYECSNRKLLNKLKLDQQREEIVFSTDKSDLFNSIQKEKEKEKLKMLGKSLNIF